MPRVLKTKQIYDLLKPSFQGSSDVEYSSFRSLILWARFEDTGPVDSTGGRGTTVRYIDQDDNINSDLAKSMVTTGNSLGMKVIAQVTEMDNPIGMMFGNSHEIAECIQCLKGEGPEDTMELVYAQADSLGYDIRPNIADGSALAEFRNMCIRQGVSEKDIDQIIGSPWSKLERSPNSVEIVSTSSGWITDIHALTIGEILCKLGAGRTGENPEINHGVGAELLVQRGSFIEEGNAWIRFDTESDMPMEMIDQVQDALTVSDSEVGITSRILQIIEE